VLERTREVIERRAVAAPLFFWRSQWSMATVTFDLMRIAQTRFWIESTRRSGLYAALALCIYRLPATAEERFERWSIEQPGDFIFALSFKRSTSFDERTATSELAFVCNQEEKSATVLLIPLDATFKNRQNSIPAVISEDRRTI
jgi:hypothetical protein